MNDDFHGNVGGYHPLNNEHQTNTFQSNNQNTHEYTQSQTSHSRSRATAFNSQEIQHNPKRQRQLQPRSTSLSQEQASNFPTVLSTMELPQCLHTLRQRQRQLQQRSPSLSQEQASNFRTVLTPTPFPQSHHALRQRQQQQEQHFPTELSTTEFTQGHHALRQRQQQQEQQLQQFHTENTTPPSLTITPVSTPLPTPLPPSYNFSTPNVLGCNTGIQQQPPASALPFIPQQLPQDDDGELFFAPIPPGVSNQQTQPLRLHNNSEYEQQPIDELNNQMVQTTAYSPQRTYNTNNSIYPQTDDWTPQNFQRNTNTHMGFDNNKGDNNYPITPTEFINNYNSPSTPNNPQRQHCASLTPHTYYPPQSHFTPNEPMNNNNNYAPNNDQPSDTSVDSCRVTAVLRNPSTYHQMKYVAMLPGEHERANCVSNNHSYDDLCHDDGVNLFSLIRKENGNPAQFRMNCSGGEHPDIQAAYPAIDLLFDNFKNQVKFANFVDYLRKKQDRKVIPLTKNVQFVIGGSAALGVELEDRNILTSENSKKIFMNGTIIPLLIHTDSSGKFGSIYNFVYSVGCGAHWEGPPGRVIKSIKDLMDLQVSPADRTKANKQFREGNFFKGT